MIKNFIFDVDRTLVDSYRTEISSLKQALFIVTNTSYNDDVMNKLCLMPTKDFFQQLGIDTTSDTMRLINRHWGRIIGENKIKFFTGMKEVLVEIKNKGYFLAIVTSRTKQELEELESLMEVIELFDVIVTSDLVEKPKPDPEALNNIITDYSLYRDETIYIGDGKNDQLAARAANIKFGFANWEAQTELTDYDYILNKPQSIYKLIR